MCPQYLHQSISVTLGSHSRTAPRSRLRPVTGKSDARIQTILTEVVRPLWRKAKSIRRGASGFRYLLTVPEPDLAAATAVNIPRCGVDEELHECDAWQSSSGISSSLYDKGSSYPLRLSACILLASPHRYDRWKW